MENIINSLFLLLNFVFIPALVYASQLALGALGVTLVYGILRFSNFAQGDLMAFGAMIVILLTWYLQSLGVSLYYVPTALLALPFAIVVTAFYILLTDRFVYRHYRKKRAKPLIYLILSIGIMFITGGLVRFIIGPGDRKFTDGVRFIVKAREMKEALGLSEGFSLKVTQGITIVITFILVGLLFWFLNRTKTGKAMRAFSDNEDLALLSGINPERVVMLTWIIVAILATVAGTLYGLDKTFKPYIYLQLLLPIFAAAIVGGLGNPLGAVAGGFVIAFSEIILTYAFKKFIGYYIAASYMPDSLLQVLSTEYKHAVSFIILVLVLLFMPRGIFKGRAL